MLCDMCKQKEAKIYYTEIVGGKKREQHLCEECAAELTSWGMELPLESILSGMFAGSAGTEVVCDRCGMSYQEFRRGGKFGCAHCYEAFARFLPGNLKRIQGAALHTGKIPQSYQKRAMSEERAMADGRTMSEEQDMAMKASGQQDSAREQPVQSETTVELSNEKMKVEQLRQKLREAIESEEYEEAARLRDLIRAKTEVSCDSLKQSASEGQESPESVHTDEQKGGATCQPNN